MPLLTRIVIEQGFKQAGPIVIPQHKIADQLLLFLLGVFAGELRAIADVLLGLFIFVDQHFEHPHIPLDVGFAGFGQQVADQWGVLLPIAIDSAVALLEHHQ